MLVLPVLVIAGIAVVVVSGRTGRQHDRPEVREVPAAPPAADGGTTWSIARALGVREAVRLARHPAVLIGTIPSLFWLFFNEGSAPVGDLVVASVPLGAFPLAGLTLVAVNLAVLRSRRNGTDEQASSLPATARARTLGHALSLVAPMAIMAVLIGARTVMLVAEAPSAVELGVGHIVELASGVALVGCAGLCGILLARWMPVPALAPLAVVGLGGLEGLLAASPQPETNRLRWLAWWVPQPDGVPVEVWPREPGWHLLYLVGLGGVVLAVALLRHDRRRATLALLAGAVILVAVSAVVQVQPMTDSEVARAVSWITHPEAHQRCETADGITTCAYPSADFSPEWRAVAAGVQSALPRRVANEVVIHQRIATENLRRLPPAVAGAIDPTAVPKTRTARPGVLAAHPELRWGGGDSAITELALGATLGSAAVGLPTEDAPECSAAGHARGVVALWLAGQATPRAATELRGWAAAPVEAEPELLEAGEGVIEAVGPLFPTIGADSWVMHAPVPVVWERGDLLLASEMLRRPRAEITAALDRHWVAATDATTSTAALAGLLALPAPPPLERIASEAGVSATQLAGARAMLPPSCP